VEAEEDVVVVDEEEEVEVEEEEAGVVAEDGTIATTITTMVLQGTTIVLQGTITILNRKPHHRCLVWKRRTNELLSPNNEMGKGMLRGGKIGRANGDLKDMFRYWGVHRLVSEDGKEWSLACILGAWICVRPTLFGVLVVQ
jgi:hypothetical protein